MPRRHETLVTRDVEQCLEVVEDALLRITLGQVAQDLRRDGAVVVVLMCQVGDGLIPDLIGPVDGFIGGFDHAEESIILQLAVGGPQVLALRLGRFRHDISNMIGGCSFLTVLTGHLCNSCMIDDNRSGSNQNDHQCV